MLSRVLLPLVCCSFLLSGVRAGEKQIPLKPYAPVPSAGQLDWHDMEMYAFIHFTTNTFTGKEWGYGDESPSVFNPTDFDADDIVKTLAEAGLKGAILTCKHHDGFCLWPTRTTAHSVASSPWKGGKGDVVKEISRACRKYGIKFGVYVSPWDRNAASYGTPEYLKMYREQIRELATGYGPLFMAWFDGANGGDGYYGGKKENRSIDRSTYYQWPDTWKKLMGYQPKAVIFSDVGPGARWVGNESGFAGYPCWSTYTPQPSEEGKLPAPGMTKYQLGVEGTADGKYWIPAEVDVSIRPGWFWHEHENGRVRTPENLLKLYFDSVGRGANLNLNVPPDRRGRLHEADKSSLKGFRELFKELYGRNYARGATVTASSSKPGCDAANVLDRKRQTFWAATSPGKAETVTLKLPARETFDVIRLAEPIQFGQRVRKFRIEVREGDSFVPWLDGSSVGARVLLRGRMVTTDEVRIILEESCEVPALSEVSLWKYPVILKAPVISSSHEGLVSIQSTVGTETRYTTDGSEPNSEAALYEKPFALPKGGMVKAVSYLNKRASAGTTRELTVATAGWKILAGERSASEPERAIDGNVETLWHTHAASGEIAPPQSLDIDMGREVNVGTVVYTPRCDMARGTIDQYDVYLSNDGKDWGQPVAKGEFSNIKANPLPQRIDLKSPIKARYMRFVGRHVVEGNHVAVAELGVIEK